MNPTPPSNPRSFTLSWLLGAGFLLAALFTLFLVLGWFRTLEALAVAGGLVALAGFIALYALLNPVVMWPRWAAYLLFSLGLVLGAGFLLDFAPTVMLAAGIGLLGLPFLWLYVERVWLLRRGGYWWAGLTAGILITLGFTLLHFGLGWPPDMLPGLMTLTFMGGAAATAFLVWAPGWQDSGARWLVYLTAAASIAAIIGALDVINLEYLIPVVLLGIAGGYFLVRGALNQA